MFSLDFPQPLDPDIMSIKSTLGSLLILTSSFLNVVMPFWKPVKFVMEDLAANPIVLDI